MMPQCVRNTPFNHSVGQPRIHHACERHRQGLVGDNAFHARPKIQDRLGACERREVLHVAPRRIDDVVDGLRRSRHTLVNDVGLDSCIHQRGRQKVTKVIPVLRLTGNQDPYQLRHL